MYRIQVDLLLILTNIKVMIDYGRPVLVTVSINTLFE